MVAYRYYLGPPRLVSDEMGDYWAPPPGTVGWVDVAPLPGQGQSADRQARGCGFYAVAGEPLPSDEYDLLAAGDLREIAMTGGIASMWEFCTGYRPPVAGTLLDALWEHLTDGSAPDGSSGPLPLMPTTRGALDLHLGGHSLVRRERFALVGPRAHRHAPRVLESLHRQYEAIERDEQRGRARPGHALRVADYWRAKYRLGAREDERESAAWRVLLPGRARGRVRRLIPHETTITESFDKVDGTGLGPDLSWTESGTWSTVSNAGRCSGNGGARADSDLSGADHYCAVNVVFQSAVSNAAGGPTVRHGLVATYGTHYGLWLQRAPQNRLIIQKHISGVKTDLAQVSHTPSIPQATRLTVDGSSLTGLAGASEVTDTDTAIAGNVRCGLVTFSEHRFDDFEAADLAVPGLTPRTYPRGALRGVLRGVA